MPARLRPIEMLPATRARRAETGLRALCGLGLAVFWAIGYFGIAAHTTTTFDPSLDIDRRIPFVGWTVWVYTGGLLWIASPLVLVTDSRLFRRMAFAYLVGMAVSFLCFAVLPTAAPTLHAAATPSQLDSASAWALLTLHRLDATVNLLPSLHVTLSWLAAEAIWRQHRKGRWACYCVAAAVTASVCLVKQHTVADVVCGLALAYICMDVSGARIMAASP
jgi:membrane-associated phospholipid phosphatase